MNNINIGDLLVFGTERVHDGSVYQLIMIVDINEDMVSYQHYTKDRKASIILKRKPDLILGWIALPNTKLYKVKLDMVNI